VIPLLAEGPDWIEHGLAFACLTVSEAWTSKRERVATNGKVAEEFFHSTSFKTLHGDRLDLWFGPWHEGTNGASALAVGRVGKDLFFEMPKAVYRAVTSRPRGVSQTSQRRSAT
jgi:hypothetical protein